SLTDYSIIKIAKKCNKLQFLDIGFGEDITSKSFCEIARSYNGLKYLRISEYQNHITDSIVYDIARSHPNLQLIDIHFSSKFTDTVIYTLTDLCLNLRSLKLEYCDEINDIAIRKIAHCRYLEHLELYSIKAFAYYNKYGEDHPELKTIIDKMERILTHFKNYLNFADMYSQEEKEEIFSLATQKKTVLVNDLSPEVTSDSTLTNQPPKIIRRDSLSSRSSLSSLPTS
ncbi:3778_t:CDS:2, partial [Funneliformis caledonium]